MGGVNGPQRRRCDRLGSGAARRGRRSAGEGLLPRLQHRPADIRPVRPQPDMPGLQLPLQHDSPRADRLPRRPGHVPRDEPQSHVPGPAVLLLQGVVQTADLPRPAAHRPDRGRRHGRLLHRRQSGRDGRPGLRLHGRQHGLRRRGESRPGHGARRQAPPARRHCRDQRWRAGAGGRPVPHADGQDGNRGQPAPREGPAAHHGPGQPGHGPRIRQLRQPGRRHPGRAGRNRRAGAHEGNT